MDVTVEHNWQKSDGVRNVTRKRAPQERVAPTKRWRPTAQLDSRPSDSASGRKTALGSSM